MGQNQWYHFGLGAPPSLACFSGDWDVHWKYDLDFDPWPFEHVPHLVAAEVEVLKSVLRQQVLQSLQLIVLRPNPSEIPSNELPVWREWRGREPK